MLVLFTSVAVFLTVVVLALAVGALLMHNRNFEARLTTLGPQVGGESAAGWSRHMEHAFRVFAEKVSQGAMNEGERGTLKLKLVQAGFLNEHAVDVFYGVRVASAAVLAVAGVFLAVTLKLPLLMTLLFLFVAAALGLYLPPALLHARVRDRVNQIQLALPDALDLMVVCVEAGGTLNGALQRVEQEMRKLHRVLCEQIRITLLEIQAGADRIEALRRMADRAPSDDVKALVVLLAQSDALGTSVADALRVFADELRRTRFLRAEEKAMELPVKMTIPLGLCIFPCLMIVIFTPAAIRIIRALAEIRGAH